MRFFKKMMKCFPKEAPISGSYPAHLCLMRAVLHACYGEGVGRNYVKQIEFDTSKVLLNDAFKVV